MTDRELLELAAEAAGIEYGGPQSGTNVSLRDTPYWNPLDDNGDALRLAIQLGFAVSIEYQVGSTTVLWGPPMGSVREAHGDNPDAATRRAIVRAAAELARIARAPRPE